MMCCFPFPNSSQTVSKLIPIQFMFLLSRKTKTKNKILKLKQGFIRQKKPLLNKTKITHTPKQNKGRQSNREFILCWQPLLWMEPVLECG